MQRPNVPGTIASAIGMKDTPEIDALSLMRSRTLRRYARSGLQRYRRVLSKFGADYGTNVIVCGPPRSGTSLVFSEAARVLTDFTPVLPSHKTKSREVSALKYSAWTGNFIGKMPSDVLFIPRIKEKSIKSNIFLVTIRDPRDILVSRHQWYNSHEYWVYPTSETAIRRSAHEKHTKYSLLEYLRAVEKASQVEKFDPSVCIIGYEDVVNGRSCIVDLLQRCGLPASKNQNAPATVYAEDEKASQRPMESQSRWASHQHKQKLRQDFNEFPILFKYVEIFGYETDRKWFQQFVEQ